VLYPDFSDAVLDFVRELSTPDTRDRRTDPEGLTEIMRLGLADESRLTDELRAAVLAPFRDRPARLALALAGTGLHPKGFVEIARYLPTLDVPVRLIYGELDRILPDVADTMTRARRELPHAELTALPRCGHFLQEEIPDELGELLAEFFAPRK
jgi:pimeloyl-ACP methyl ester carboxylesterase